MIALVVLAQMVEVPAGGIPRAVPPTGFTCDVAAGDGSRFTIAGVTPEFPKGWNPNRSKPVKVDSSHEAFRGIVGIDPGEASEWFRDFQVSTYGKDKVSYTLQLKLRRNGTSVAFGTRYESTGQQVPFDYYGAGLCKADFTPATGVQERGQ